MLGFEIIIEEDSSRRNENVTLTKMPQIYIDVTLIE